jgi:hypothetical protein
MYFRRVRIVGRTFAAVLTRVSTVFMPPALAAQNLGVGLWRPCRGQTCGSVLGAMARIAPARPATPRSTTIFRWIAFLNYASTFKIPIATHHHAPRTRSQNFMFSPGANSAESPCRVAAFVVNSEPHTGASPSDRVCVWLIDQATAFNSRSLLFSLCLYIRNCLRNYRNECDLNCTRDKILILLS